MEKNGEELNSKLEVNEELKSIILLRNSMVK
jgi:hypothetical protein